MYFPGDSLEGTIAYIHGYDAARDFGPLQGLREWLVVRGAIGENQGWGGIDTPPSPLTDTPAAVGELLGDFFRYRREVGVTKIHMDYARWLLRKRSYEGPLRVSKRLRRSGEA
jgi:hypothetical protein